MQAYWDWASEYVLRFKSYESVVMDINDFQRVITFYPQWHYSQSTIKQIKAFLEEHVGYVTTSDLHKCRKNPDIGLRGYSVVFSNDFPYGY